VEELAFEPANSNTGAIEVVAADVFRTGLRKIMPAPSGVAPPKLMYPPHPSEPHLLAFWVRMDMNWAKYAWLAAVNAT
jgi:hypothetical protein